MKKIIFSDIDKTLCMKKDLTENTINIINKYISFGGTFILVSGRGVKYTKMIANKIGNIRYIICNNGAIGYDIRHDKVIYKVPINIKSYEEICKIAKWYDCSLIINTTNKMYAKGYYTKDGIYSKIDSIYDDKYDKDDVMQIVLSCSKKEDTKKVIDQIEKINGIKIINRHRSLYDDNYPEKENVWIDLTNENVNKGYGVDMLCKHLNINLIDTVRIGDDLNDMTMFFDEGVNIAVENGISNLKDKADIIVPSCTDEGAYKAISDIIDEKI